VQPDLVSRSVEFPFESLDRFCSSVARSQFVNVFDRAATKRTNFDSFCARNADFGMAARNYRSLLIFAQFGQNCAADFADSSHFLKFNRFFNFSIFFCNFLFSFNFSTFFLVFNFFLIFQINYLTPAGKVTN